MKTWLTVVIPSYKGETWIKQALESIVVQWEPGIEVIFVDGGPTSAARRIAETYASRLDLVIFDRHDLTSWHSKTNFGVSMARSEHLCWLGVDDVWLPGRVVALKRWLSKYPDAALHLSASAIIGKSAHVLGKWRCPLPSECRLRREDVLSRFLIQNFVAAPAPVFRRDSWIQCGGLDESLWYTADWDIWLKLTRLGPVVYHDEATIGFRIHAKSLTVTGSRDAEDFLGQMQVVVRRHSAAIGDNAGVLRIADASMRLNLTLALVSQGKWHSLLATLWQVLMLGPAGVSRYVINSRIHERLAARLRAKVRRDF